MWDKMDKTDKFITAMFAIIILFLALIVFGAGIKPYHYEYLDYNGETHRALDCYMPTRSSPEPYCISEDGSRVYGIQSFKWVED